MARVRPPDSREFPATFFVLDHCKEILAPVSNQQKRVVPSLLEFPFRGDFSFPVGKTRGIAVHRAVAKRRLPHATDFG
jgi:hypothetical protein